MIKLYAIAVEYSDHQQGESPTSWAVTVGGAREPSPIFETLEEAERFNTRKGYPIGKVVCLTPVAPKEDKPAVVHQRPKSKFTFKLPGA